MATTTTTADRYEPTAPTSGVAQLVTKITGVFERVPNSVIQLSARLAIAPVFWLSGQTKVDGWSIKDSTFDLFRYEYAVPVIPPELAAYMATTMEHALPVLLVVGLATRFAALGLLGMTMVIQLFVYPEAWTVHVLWAALLLLIVARGAGVVSLDHLIGRRFSVRP